MQGLFKSATGLSRTSRLAAAAFAVVAAAGLLVKGGSTAGIVFAAVGVVGAIVVLAIGLAQVRAEIHEEEASRLRASTSGIEVASVAKALSDHGMYRLGVEPEAPQALSAIGLDPSDHAPYFPRPGVDGALMERLQRGAKRQGVTLVVLRGPSKAGKTRTLTEALGRGLPNAWLIRPRDASAVVELARAGPPKGLRHAPCVIWLDDLERYIAYEDAGLNPGTLPLFESWRRPVIVLAAFGGRMGQGIDPLKNPADEMLRGCEPIDLAASMSEEETGLLRAHPTYASVAERIATEGIGEFMIVATAIRNRLVLDHSCPEGLAIARVAVDWRRCGMQRPAPKEALEELYVDHLDGPPSEHRFETGMIWATKRLYSSNVALLRSDGAGYSPYDYAVRVEEEGRREILAATVTKIVDRWAEGDELIALGEIAWSKQQYETAETAFARADEAGSANGAGALGALVLILQKDREKALPILERGDRRGSGLAAQNLGAELLATGDLVGARAAYARADARGDADGTNGLGVTLLRQSDRAGALATFRRADERGSTDGSLNLARLLRGDGDMAGAEAAYLRAARRSLDGVIGHGEMLERRGETEGAERAYRFADEQGSSEGAVMLGLLLSRREDAEAETEGAFRRAHERGNPRGAYYLGVEIFERDEARAEQLFLQADEGGIPIAADAVGHFLVNRNDLDGAEAAFRRADERGSRTGSFDLGVLLSNRDDLAGAATAFSKAEERGNDQGATALGLILERAGKIEDAELAYRRADEQGSQDGAFLLGTRLLARNDTRGALGAFKRAVERGSTEAHGMIGRILEERGDKRRARAAFRRGDQAGDPEASCLLGIALEKQGDLKGAEAAFQRADERGSAFGAHLLGWILRRQGDSAGGEAAYSRAIDRGSGSAAYDLYEIRWKRGDRYAAVLSLRRAAQLDHPGAEAKLSEVTRSR